MAVLENNRFYWIRVIKGIDKNPGRYSSGFLKGYNNKKEAWDITLNKTPIQIVKPMALAIQEYIKTHVAFSLYSTLTDHSPLHFAAYFGLFDICKYIIEKMKEFRPDL